MAGAADLAEAIARQNRIGIPDPERCGANRHGIPDIGCGERLDDPHDRYKCVDCDVTFHRHCARRHFVNSGDERNKALADLDEENQRLRSAISKLIKIPK